MIGLGDINYKSSQYNYYKLLAIFIIAIVCMWNLFIVKVFMLYYYKQSYA